MLFRENFGFFEITTFGRCGATGQYPQGSQDHGYTILQIICYLNSPYLIDGTIVKQTGNKIKRKICGSNAILRKDLRYRENDLRETAG